MGIEPAESVDYDLSVPGIDTAGAEIRSVIISRFKDNVYYARLVYTSRGKSYEVDCPPAKALT